MKSNAGRINLKILSFSPFFCPDQDRSGIESQSLRERSGLSVFLFSYIFLRPFSSHGRRRSSIIFLGNSRLSFFFSTGSHVREIDARRLLFDFFFHFPPSLQHTLVVFFSRPKLCSKINCRTFFSRYCVIFLLLNDQITD